MGNIFHIEFHPKLAGDGKGLAVRVNACAQGVMAAHYRFQCLL